MVPGPQSGAYACMDRHHGDQLPLPTSQVGGSKTFSGGVDGLVSGPTPILYSTCGVHTLTLHHFRDSKIKAPQRDTIAYGLDPIYYMLQSRCFYVQRTKLPFLFLPLTGHIAADITPGMFVQCRGQCHGQCRGDCLGNCRRNSAPRTCRPMLR